MAVYGHFNWVLDKPGWADLAEDPEAGGRWGRWVATVGDPRYLPLVFDLFVEVVDVFAPRIFHIGHDEITFQPIGVHPMTQQTPPADLLAEEVIALHGWLAERDLQVMMWGDQLLPDHNGGAPYFTAGAIDRIPRDIIIADWHYGALAWFPSVAFFRQHGFQVLPSGWWQPLNVWNSPNVAVDEQVMGFSGTSWWNLARFAESAEHQTAFVLAAENAWSNRHPDIGALSYRPGTVWRRFAGWTASAPETRYAPIDLRRFAVQSIAQTGPRTGWPLPATHQVPCPRRCGPFRSGRGPTLCICCRPAACRPSAPRTSIPRDSEYPKRIGHWLVTHDNGASVEVPIAYRQTLTDWNDGLPPAQATCMWSGGEAGGADVALAACRWENPHPDRTIVSLDVEAEDSPLRIAVLAVTAAVE